MIRSLSAADSGIQANQTYLDVLGNNIANVNTTGYKETSVQFADLLNQQVAGPGAPTAGLASTNPSAVGSGTTVASISTNFNEGALNQTNVATDVAIQGNGFLMTNANGQIAYTRAGNLQFDANGVLSTPTGAEVQGWMASGTGVLTTSNPTTSLTIPTGATISPNETANVTMGGNLPADTPVSPAAGSVQTTTINAYDALGNVVPITLSYTHTGAGTWSLQGTATAANGTTSQLWATPQNLTFSGAGQLQSINGTPMTTNTYALTATPPAGWTGPLSIDFPPPGKPSSFTQYAGNNSAAAVNQDGSSGGTLASYSISANGTITGTFSNGRTQALAQIALASFSNPGGLTSLGGLSYQSNPASGAAQVGTPGSGPRGTLMGGALEASNVNLAGDLTNLITAQTAYQANTKVVATSATVLQSLINMP